MKNFNFELLSLFAIILGIILGITVPDGAVYFEFMGSIFLSLLKGLILPIIIFSLFLAIARISDVGRLKELGIKTFGYYALTSSIAVITGLVLANIFIFQNNYGTIEPSEAKTGVNFVERIFSTNIFNSLANGEILHVVVFTILFSLAFIGLADKKKTVILEISESLYDVFMKLIGWILKLAPLGILSLVWSTISTFDSSTFNSVASFFMATAIAAFIHAFLTLPLIGRFIGRFNVRSYFWDVKQALIVSFATASSAATLPVSTKVVEDHGVAKKVSRFVLPIGATLNMDGSALFQALIAMLFVSLAGIDISLGEQLLLFTFILLSSAGTAGIPSGGIVMMTMVIHLLDIPNPDYYLGLYVMVDRFWDYPITSINVWGDLIGAKTVDGFVD